MISNPSTLGHDGLTKTKNRNPSCVVVDLGFGDAGKGLLTDYLVRRHGAGVVVRFNGGAQAGHNVVTAEGRHHTFSQFGSGSFVPGVRTHLASAVIVHPTALAVEAERLRALGLIDIWQRLSISPECRVTTPYQQASGRLRELLRGDQRHGSCGVGIGETAFDAERTPELGVRFADLLEPQRLRDVLHAQRAEKLREFRHAAAESATPAVMAELAVLADASALTVWLEAAHEVARRVRIESDGALARERQPLIFEGAQGVLLDQDYRFFPFVTFSRCAVAPALELLAQLPAREVVRVGVLRTHLVRHGPGPFPTEAMQLSTSTAEPHNLDGPHQGRVRKGYPDLVLLDYAVRAGGPFDAIALTHVDSLEQQASYRLCDRYAEARSLELPSGRAQQVELTERLGAVRPHLIPIPTGPRAKEALARAFSETTRLPVRYFAHGPRAQDVRS